jgi:hypothetical protein
MQHIANTHTTYSSGPLALKKQDKSKSHSSRDIGFEEHRKVHLSDHTINRDILKELETQPVFVQVNSYNSKWIQRISRMERSRS